MDRSNDEAGAASAGSPIRMLMLAACVPFAVMGLLASPMAFNAVRHLVGV